MEVSHLDVEVTSLPPLRLNFELPRDYPSSSSPKFSLTSKWMPIAILTKIAKKLDALWQQNAGMEVGFNFSRVQATMKVPSKLHESERVKTRSHLPSRRRTVLHPWGKTFKLVKRW